MKISLQSIGTVHNERTEIIDDYWGSINSVIEFDSTVLADDALEGITEFSHIEVVFYMDRVSSDKIVKGARHPRNDTSLPKFGILAQRGKNRPNQIGISFAKVISVEGLKLTVCGLDAINGTPVLDIKPCFKEFLPHDEIKQAEWSHNLMANYYK